MNYAYVRVSTDKQTGKNQELTIEDYCKRNKLKKLQIISEIISGTKSPEKRKLGKLIEEVKSGDTVIVTELSRLGRSLIMILNVLQKLLDKNVQVIAIKENFILGDNIQSKVIAFAFGLSAEIERQLISERTKQGLERVRKQGKHIGRKKGQKPKKYKLTGKTTYIRKELKKGRSILSLSKELKVTWKTLKAWIRNCKIA